MAAPPGGRVLQHGRLAAGWQQRPSLIPMHDAGRSPSDEAATMSWLHAARCK